MAEKTRTALIDAEQRSKLNQPNMSTAGQRHTQPTIQRTLGNYAMNQLVMRQVHEPQSTADSARIIHPRVLQARHQASARTPQSPAWGTLTTKSALRTTEPGETSHLKVNSPGDAYEKAAEAVAEQVMQAQGAAAQAESPPPEPPDASTLQRTTPAVLPQTATLIRSPGPGRPLSPSTRRQIEPHLGADLSAVRVHSGPHVADATHALGARAFTYGTDIFLGPRESTQDTRLMAHEAAHVVQQRAVAPAATPAIQRDLLDDVGDAASSAVHTVSSAAGSVVDTVSSAAGEVVEMGADYFWGLIERNAPTFAPILREIKNKGILGYFGEMIRGTFRSIFDTLRADPGIIGTLTTTFLMLFAQAQVILAALASGDCGPLFAAMSQLKETVAQMAGDAWNAITEFFQPVGDFFSDLWQKFGAPLVDWLTAMAGDVWAWIQNLGAQIWAWTQPVRDALSAAWDWVVEQIFGHEDPQGNSEGGLVNWITDMAGQAWDAIKTELEPVIAPIRSFAESVMALIPLDAILNLRETVQGWLSNVQDMTQNMSQPQDVANNQTSLREILPGVLASIATLSDGIVGAGQWIATQVGSVVETVTAFFVTLGGIDLLSPISGAISWVQETIGGLSTWAQETVIGLFTNIGDGLVYLSQFIEPVVTMLQQLVSVVTDLIGVLPNFIAGIWNRIPACIREPIQTFIVDNILSQIPIFAQILQIPDIWARISQTVMTILRQVFVDGNLAGAAWTFFQALLSVLGIPPELVVNIISKAATALSDILGDPVGFFLNLLRAVKQGFLNFFGNIGRHLLTGVTGWLFEELRQANIQPPQDVTLRSIVGFVLDVLGITVDNFFERLGRRIGPARAQRIRRIFNVITGALSWVVRLINEGPGALWEEIQSQISNLWHMVLQAVIGWLNRTLIERAMVKLISMLDPTGIMAVVNSLIALYNAIQSVVQYIRQILEVVNTVLDGIGGIARGAIGQAANFLESGLVRILPIAIGFLANQVGLSGLGRRIGEMVETVRGYVNRGIDWLINTSINAFNALLGRGESEPAVGGIKGQASALARQEIGAGKSPAEVELIVGRIYRQLQSQGLHSLVLRREDEGYSVFASASAEEKVLDLKTPARAEDYAAQMTARITIANPEEGLGIPESRWENVRDRPVGISNPSEFMERQAQMPVIGQAAVGQRGRGRRGPVTSVVVARPPAGANEILVRTFSGGGRVKGRTTDNSAHAEVQLQRFLAERLEWTHRISHIELQINYSPCRLCGAQHQTMRAVKNLLIGTPDKNARLLSWSTWYNDPHIGTRPEDIAQLGQDWTVSGPMPAEVQEAADKLVPEPAR